MGIYGIVGCDKRMSMFDELINDIAKTTGQPSSGGGQAINAMSGLTIALNDIERLFSMDLRKNKLPRKLKKRLYGTRSMRRGDKL